MGLKSRQKRQRWARVDAALSRWSISMEGRLPAFLRPDDDKVAKEHPQRFVRLRQKRRLEVRRILAGGKFPPK